MKRIKQRFYSFCGVRLCLVLAGFLCMPVLLCAETPSNNLVSMVTYFPVPYAAYNNLYVSKKLDIGLRNNFELELNSDPTSGGEHSLEAAESVLWKGTLALDMPVLVSDSAYFGTTTPADATLTFNKNLLIGQIQNNAYKTSGHTPVQLVSSPKKIRVRTDVFLFGNNNNAKLPKSCEDTIYWQQLSSSAGSHFFLVCGESEVLDPLEECTWTKGDLVVCSIDSADYCSIVGSEWKIRVLQESSCPISGEDAVYFSAGGACGEKPTSVFDICIAYENHEEEYGCKEGALPPSGDVHITARIYKASCINH